MPDFRVSTIVALDGQVAVVTGGGTGIGLAIAQGLAANGATVYITGRRKNLLDEAAKTLIEGAKSPLQTIQMDVNDKESILAAVKEIEGKEGKLDLLVNNAGILGKRTRVMTDPNSVGKNARSVGEALFEDDFANWAEVFSNNVSSIYFVTAAFLNLLTKGADKKSTDGNKDGTSGVINISSVNGRTHVSLNQYAYTTSKGAVEHLTKVLANDFAIRGLPIRVNAIAPGPFPSQMTGDEEELDAKVSKEAWPGAVSGFHIPRSGSPHEIATTALYLASPAAAFMNGQSLAIDGGFEVLNP